MEEPPPSTHAEDATTPGPDRDEEAEDISDEIHQQIEGKDSCYSEPTNHYYGLADLFT